MSRKILFVVRQAGSAAFCLPVWRKWLVNLPACDWSIIADPQALNVLEGQGLPLVKSWGEVPDDDGFDLIVSSATNDNFERQVSAWASVNRIKRIQFLDAPYNTQSRLTNSNQGAIKPQGAVVLDSDVMKEALLYGLSPDEVTVVGHPGWEEISNQSYPLRSEKTVLFAAQPLSELPELKGLGYDEKIVWDLLCDFKNHNPEMIDELVYCPHPSQKDIPEDFETGTRLIECSEDPLTVGGTMVGMFTALMVDAFLSGQRVVSLQPGLRMQDHCLLSNKELIPLVTSYGCDDLVQAMMSVSYDNEGFAKKIAGSLERFERVLLGQE